MVRAHALTAAFFFVCAMSLVVLPGSDARVGFHLGIPLARANVAPSEFWYPAGPSMNSLQDIIFTDASTEFLNFRFGNAVDLTDVPLFSTLVSQFVQDPGFFVAYPAQGSILGLDFNMVNNFWGCSFNFSITPCGVEIRQGIAHLIDRTSFAINSQIAPAAAVDDPAGFSIPSPNPCAWDASFPQTGNGCVVGSGGGTAYHLRAATGVNYPWQPPLGSPDFCSAAQHFINAGLARAKNPNCVLTGVGQGVTANTVKIFIRSDNDALSSLGFSMVEEICALFGQGFVDGCLPFLGYDSAGISAFPGFSYQNPTQPNLTWWIYTSGGSSFTSASDISDMVDHDSPLVSGDTKTGPDFTDVVGDNVVTALSTYVTEGPFDHPQCASTISSYTPSNYASICNPAYDAVANRILSAPCFTAAGDPAPGQPNNTPGGNCTGTTQLSATSAGIQAEDVFGRNVYALPVAISNNPYAYHNNWSRIINSQRSGVFNYFSWLNGYSSNPASFQTIRQGFSQSTRSTNPYDVSTPWDIAVVRTIYDSLTATDPASGDPFSWMIYGVTQQSNDTVRSQSGYEPPPSTATTYHFTLRQDVFFQDGRPVTSYDVAFSYLSLVGSGSTLGVGGSIMTGITILGPRSFDIGVKESGLFNLPLISGLPIIPGRYWTLAGSSAYDAAVAACTGSTSCSKAQFALSGANVVCPGAPHPGCASFDSGNLQVDPQKIIPSFDPIANGILIGSGPWACIGRTGTVGGGCSSTGAQDPPVGGSYSLTRFGCTAPGNCLPPASSTSGIYFRSSGDLAIYVWSEENDVAPIAPVSAVSNCYGQPVNPNGGCAHWQQGIGASASGVVGLNQISTVQLRYNLNWIAPFEAATNLPPGMGAVNPVLYEGTTTLQPCNVSPTTGYDC